MNNKEKKGYIVPFAKQRGLTSFSALSVIKHRLNIKKVGHTGTLDSFADGLLVAVTGNLTRLASFIEEKNKEYEALISFGCETDTLDILGEPILKAPLPSYNDIEKIIREFIGCIMQEPPQYSALHVDGRRASDIVRSGGIVKMAPRNIYIEEINIKGIFFDGDKNYWKKDISTKISKDICNKKVKLVHITVICSKGTYIRALARDIARAIGSASHLKALRRLSVGPFKLENAFGRETLPPFLSEEEKSVEYLKKIDEYLTPLSRNLSAKLAFFILDIKEEFVTSFLHGKNIKDIWFHNMEENKKTLSKGGRACVFFCDKVLGIDKILGIIDVQNKNYKYKVVF